MRTTPRAAGPMFAAARAARPRRAIALFAARPRATALFAARPRAAALAARPRRAIAVLAVLAVAAALAAAILLGAGSASGPAEPGVVPLRISSGQGIATGFAVADGRVVTVAHVLDGPVTVAGRRVRVIRVDRRNDLALLSAPGVRGAAPDSASAAPDSAAATPDRRAAAPHSASAVSGEHLRVVRLRDGRPSMLSVHVRRSIVAHVRAPGAAGARVRPALELSAAEGRGHVAPGDSGAAVVTDSGEVAGIVFAASRNRLDTGYAVDASRLRQLLR